MAAKLTTSQISDRLGQRGFSLVGDYINSTTSTLVRCSNGHVYSTRIANIINRGDDCSICSEHSSKSRYSMESINDALSFRGIKMIDEFTTVNDKNRFQCLEGHTWVTTAGSVIGGTGCQKCHGNFKWSIEYVKEVLSKKNIVLESEYLGSNIRSKFRCEQGHSWMTVPRSIVKNNTNCPSCASYGFKQNEPAWVYVLKFEKFIKYGITNDLKQRINTHSKRNGNNELIETRFFQVGMNALNLEKQIKQTLGGNYVTRDECPDGYTETLSLDKTSLLLEMMTK